MSERLLTIKTAENGFVIEVVDKKIQAQNEKSKSVYEDPEREFVLKTPDDVIALVTKIMSGVDLPKSDKDVFDQAFKEATNPKGAK
jgi:GTP cyclohydrolase I